MSPILDKGIKENLVIRNGVCYYYVKDNEKIKLGSKKVDANKALISILEKDSKSTNETTKTNLEKDKKTNPTLDKSEKISSKTEKEYEALAANILDIEHYDDRQKFGIFIHGIDSLLSDHPTIKACPYEFCHQKISTSIKNGNSTTNKGWMVLPKSLVITDPRTGKTWLEVAHDDTPEGEFYTVGKYVLCYTDKIKLHRKRAKRTIISILKPSKEIDKRQELSEKVATSSRTNPQDSMAMLKASNQQARKQMSEHLKENKKMSSSEINNMFSEVDNLDTEEIQNQVAKANELVQAGKVGKTLKDTKQVSINDI